MYVLSVWQNNISQSWPLHIPLYMSLYWEAHSY